MIQRSDLLEALAASTDVPIVLDASFNENVPIVFRPEEALACFLRTGMDLLVLGDHVVARGRNRAADSSARASSAESTRHGTGTSPGTRWR